MGVDFLRKVISLQKKYGRSGAVVANGLQTNATLIDDDLAAHLARYNFLLGCSLDGPAPIHDRYRLTAGGLPTHHGYHLGRSPCLPSLPGIRSPKSALEPGLRKMRLFDAMQRGLPETSHLRRK